MTVLNNTEEVFGLNMAELEAIAGKLNGVHQVRFNPEDTWTAEKELDLRNRINIRLTEIKAEEALLKAEIFNPTNGDRHV